LQKSHKTEYGKLKEEYDNKNFNQIYNLLKNETQAKGNLDFVNFKEKSSNSDDDYKNNNYPNRITIDNNLYKCDLQDEKEQSSNEYVSKNEENESSFNGINNHKPNEEIKDNKMKNDKEISNGIFCILNLPIKIILFKKIVKFLLFKNLKCYLFYSYRYYEYEY